MTPVDIMLVTFNQPEAVKAVVALLYRHTASPFRLLIADNGRDPQMLDFLHRVARKKDNVLLVENAENKFCCVATNQLLSLCESPYIFYLCSYETFVVKPAWDLACIHAMEAHPSAGMGGHLSWSKHYVTGADYAKQDFFPKFRNPEYAVRITEKKCSHIQGGFFILRKAMYDQIGGFNEALQHAYMDVEYSYYAESMGWRLFSLPTVLSIHRTTRPNLDAFNLRDFDVIHPLTMDQCLRELPEVALSLPWEETLITNDRLENGGATPVHAEESSPNDVSSTVLERDVTRQTAMNRILTDEETRRLKVENVRHQIVNFYPQYIDPYLRVGGLKVLAIGAGNAPEIVWAVSRGARSIHATSLHMPDESWKSIAEEMGIRWEGHVTTGVLDVCKDHLDKEFDAIIGINCWEHLPDPQQCLTNCLQMLKDGGLLFIFSCPFYWSSDGSHFGRYRGSDPWVHLSKDNEELKQYVSAHEWRQYNTLNKINVSQTWEYASQMPMIFEDFTVLPDLQRNELPSIISVFSRLPNQPIDLTVRGVRFALRRSKTLEQHLRTNFHS